MEITAQLPIYFAYLTLSIVLFYTIGHIVLHFIFQTEIKTKYATLLSKTLVGMLLFVLLFSFFQSSFLTINLAFIPILFVLGYFLKNSFIKLPPRKKSLIGSFLPHYQTIIFTLLVLIILFGLKSTEVVSTSHEYLTTESDGTMLHYVQIVDLLATLGIENRNMMLNAIDPNYQGIVPYHFFEFWLCASYVKFLGLNSLITFLIIFQPLLLYLLALSYMALCETIAEKIISVHFLLSFLFVFSCFAYFNFFFKIGEFLYAFHTIHGNHAVPYFRFKVALIEIFLVCITTLFLKKQEYLAFLLLLVLPILFVTTAPAIFSAICLFACWKIIYNQDRKQYVLLFTLCFIQAITMGLIWYLFQPKINTTIDMGWSVQNIIVAFKEKFLHYLLAMPILYAPYSILFLLLLYVLNKTKLFSLPQPFFIFPIMLFVAVCFASLHTIFDWHQFYINLAYPLYKILFTALLSLLAIRYFKSFKILGVVVAISMLVLSFRTVRNMQLNIKLKDNIQYYAVNFLEEVQIELQKHNQDYLLGLALFDSTYLIEKREHTHLQMEKLGVYTAYMKNNCMFMNISWYKAYDKLDALNQNAVRDNPFYVFIEQQKKKGNFVSYEISLRDFILTYNIKFIATTQTNILEKSISDLVKKKIIDSKTGEHFYVLKN